MKLAIRAFAILSLPVLAHSVSYAQTLTAGQAQKLAHICLFRTYEKALIACGLDTARP